MSLAAESYEAQLRYLASAATGFKALGAWEQLQMILSLAQSVRKARDCDFNHRTLSGGQNV